MTPHPDQLTPDEAAGAANVLSGLTERLGMLRYRIETFEGLVGTQLPLAAAEDADNATPRANLELAEVQRGAAEAACEILAGIGLLSRRLALAAAGLEQALTEAEQAEVDADALTAAFIAAHFGKAA